MNTKLRFIRLAAMGSVLCAFSVIAHAEIVIGAILSETGPGASLGVPYKNALELQDKNMGGETVRLVMLNDNSDPTLTVKNAQRLMHEMKVDVIIGPSNVPQAMAAIQFADKFQTAMLPLAPLSLPDDKKSWAFVVPQSVGFMVDGVVQDMKKRNVRSAAYIGFSDSWGDAVWAAFKNAAEAAGIEVTTNERYARTDTSVKAQVLRILGQKPDAVMVGGSGTPGALPHIELSQSGYKGLQYSNHGAVNQDFLRVGGKEVAGTIAPTGPLVVIDQLPGTHPLKKIGEEFMRRYEARYGAGTANPFAGYANDAYLMIRAAAPAALAKAKPGTTEFRIALRDALERISGLDGTEATYTFTPEDRYGARDNARVMVQAKDGVWSLLHE